MRKLQIILVRSPLSCVLKSGRGRLLLGLALVVLVAGPLFVPLFSQGAVLNALTHHSSLRTTQQTEQSQQRAAQMLMRQQAAMRTALTLHVAGNRLVTASGRTVVLRGVNRDGTDFLCAEGHGIFDGPTGPNSITALLSWHVNAVRIPLNEACWLGLPGVPKAYRGAPYRDAIASYVTALNDRGIYVILDLHKNAPGSQVNSHLFEPAADADHALAFWSNVATRFRGEGMVLFDLFNEPHDISWQCWRDGGDCAGVPYPVAGMQSLVDAVRHTGAKNVLLLTGDHWGNDLSQWLTYMPTDQMHNLAASWHVYTVDIDCATVACYDAIEAPLAAQVPLVVGEFGVDLAGQTCNDIGSIDTLLAWLDAHGASYLAWTWNVGSQDCGSLSLISSWSGTPHAPNGTTYRAHLLAITQPTH